MPLSDLPDDESVSAGDTTGLPSPAAFDDALDDDFDGVLDDFDGVLDDLDAADARPRSLGRLAGPVATLAVARLPRSGLGTSGLGMSGLASTTAVRASGSELISGLAASGSVTDLPAALDLLSLPAGSELDSDTTTGLAGVEGSDPTTGLPAIADSAAPAPVDSRSTVRSACEVESMAVAAGSIAPADAPAADSAGADVAGSGALGAAVTGSGRASAV